MFGSGRLKKEVAELTEKLAAAETRNSQLQAELESQQQMNEQVQADKDSVDANQQQRFRELWFSGSSAVSDIRENLAHSATTLREECHYLDTAQSVFTRSSDILGQMVGALQNIAADATANCGLPP